MPNYIRLFAGWLTALLATASIQAAPTIVITNLPAYGTTNDLMGVVSNVNFAAYAVAVFINVPDAGGWYSKPTCPGAPLTTIQPDGSWRADITTGPNDIYATQVAALLVSTNYNQPCVLGSQFLPTNVFAQAVASVVVHRTDPYQRWISFSGYNWSVKTGDGSLLGPGPNYFSDSTSNVWTDAQGWLHLRITHRTNQWQCAEILSALTFGYGTYRFEVNTPVDALNSRVILGLFTWSDDPVYAYREIDVECARWSVPSDTNNAQFVLQPYYLANQLVRYRVPPTATNVTFLFTWETNRISWQSQIGSYSPNPAPSNIISSYVFTNAANIPRTGDENVDLNLWLDSGNAPTDSQETEVILKNFQFVPLGTPVTWTISGAVELQSFAGTNRMVRLVASQASGNATNYLQTNDLTLPFTNGVAGYSLQAPTNTTHLSAKTAWNLRQRQLVTFTFGTATVNFTNTAALKGGDLVTVTNGTIINTDNAVTSSDYLFLLGNYLQTVGGDPAIARADMDGSGAITSSDYLLLLGNYLTAGDPQ